MIFHSLIAASLAASVFAVTPEDSRHKHQEKRDVVYVTNTVYVYDNGDIIPSTSVENAPSVASSVQPEVSDAESATASSSKSNSQVSVGSAGAAGIVYSPYSSSGECKSKDEVASDLDKLKGYNIIRIYGVDCNQVENVLDGKQANQKVFAGIFNMASLDADISTLASAVKASSGGWDNIDTVSIGNELVNSGQATTAQIGSYVSSAKSQLSDAGYTGPVVAVDTFNAVLKNPDLCDYSDYIAINAHAFFDSSCDASNAGPWALSILQSVSSACGNSKKVMITESGWPHEGTSNGKAVPSVANQQASIASLKLTVGDSVILFSAFDDLWKSNSASTFGAEKYWGFIN